MEAKAQNGGLGSKKILNHASAAFLSEGGKFLGGKIAFPPFF